MAEKTTLILLLAAFVGSALTCDILECSKKLEQHYFSKYGLVFINPANKDQVCRHVDTVAAACSSCLEKEDTKDTMGSLIRPLNHVCMQNLEFLQNMTDCQNKLISKELTRLRSCVTGHATDNCNDAKMRGQCVWRLAMQVCGETQADFQLRLQEKAFSANQRCDFSSAKETLKKEIEREDDKKQKIVVGVCVCLFAIVIILTSIIYLKYTKADDKSAKLQSRA